MSFYLLYSANRFCKIKASFVRMSSLDESINTDVRTDPSFFHRHRLGLNTLYGLPFYSACSDSPGKKSPWRQMERFSLRLKEKAERGLERRSTSTAWNRPCRRSFPQSSASGSRACSPWSSLDTSLICNSKGTVYMRLERLGRRKECSSSL